MKTTVLPIATLTPSGFRKSLGNLFDLREHIAKHGLLRPLVVTSEGLVLSGNRRLAACKELGWTEIPVIVTDDVLEAAKLLEGDLHDGTCALGMKLTERVRQGFLLEAMDAERAENYKKLYMVRARKKESMPPKFPKKREIVPSAVGWKAQGSWDRMRKVLLTAEDESSPLQAQAIRWCAEADEKGQVQAAYEKWMAARRKSGDVQIKAIPVKSPAQNKRTADRAWSIANYLGAAAPGLLELDPRAVRAGNSDEENAELLKVIGDAIHSLGVFKKRIKR